MDSLTFICFYLTFFFAAPSPIAAPPNRCEQEYRETMSALSQATLLTAAERAEFIRLAQQRLRECQAELKLEEQQRLRDLEERARKILKWMEQFWQV